MNPSPQAVKATALPSVDSDLPTRGGRQLRPVCVPEVRVPRDETPALMVSGQEGGLYGKKQNPGTKWALPVTGCFSP